MPIDIPHTFVAGTKAKASDVNDNFEAIEEFVDGLETDVNSTQVLAESLVTDKADVNGTADETFAMANAVTEYDGVNLRTLKNLTANTKDAVTGFVVSKQSNTSIMATPGACWDISYTKMIQSATSLVRQVTSLSANSTYYVYVIMDASTEEVSLTISTSSVTPEVTTGIYYRRLAVMTTDANGYVDVITNDHVIATTASSIGFIGDRIYTAPTSPASFNFWIRGGCYRDASYYNIYINGNLVAAGASSSKWGNTITSIVPVKKGQTFSYSAGGESADIQFYEMI